MSSPAANSSINRPVAGAMWMFGSGLCFVAVNGIVKFLGRDIPAPEAAFLRYSLGLVFLIPMLRPILRARLSRRAIALFSLRGLVHSLAVMLWFFAMARIPIAEVQALNYLAPVFVTIGAAVFLGERLALRRIMAVVVALLGVMIILRPGIKAIVPGDVAMLFAALMFAASYLIAKRMSSEVSPPVVVGMLSISVTIGLAPFAIAVWQPPSWTTIAWLLTVAAFATVGHLMMTEAFRLAPVTVTQPVSFLQLLWAALLGVMFFAEPVDAYVVTGGGLIIAAIGFITWREAVLNRRPVTPSAPPPRFVPERFDARDDP